MLNRINVLWRMTAFTMNSWKTVWQIVLYRFQGKCLPAALLWGWVLTINSRLQVSDELKMVKGVEFLSTQPLGQDSLENVFSFIRGKVGFRDNPGPKHFRETLKQTMVSSMFNLSHPDGANCQMDTARYIFDMGSMSVSKRRSNDQVSSTAAANSYHCDFALSANDLPQDTLLCSCGMCQKDSDTSWWVWMCESFPSYEC